MLAVVVMVVVGVEGTLSPAELGLRGEVGAGGWLEEAPPSPYDPRPADLNTTALRAKLGPALDPHNMQITKPKDPPPPHVPFRRTRNGRLVPTGEMPGDLRGLELGWVRLGDGSKLRTRLGSRLRRKLRRLLWALTACPVGWAWRDLGPRFWPRFLKAGLCPPGSCSVPPGMSCRPSATKHRTILRWHCPRARPPCSWIKVHYPVVTGCSCACPHAT